MKPYLQLNSQSLAYAFGGVLLFGAVVSSITSTDNRWMNWHFSRLGEGGMLSSWLFNIALIIAAVIFFKLGRLLKSSIANVHFIKKSELVKAESIISKSFITISVCFVGVALFPFDLFPVVHDLFGYSMLFIFLALCLVMYRVLPIFSLYFNIYSNLVILCTVVCYILFFGFSVITLLIVESVIFTILYVWLIMFIRGINNKVVISNDVYLK